MTPDLIARVRAALGADWDVGISVWAGLIRLYESDPEAFYLLACDGVEPPSDPMVALAGFREVVVPLAALAQRIRKAVRASYRLAPPGGGEGSVVTQNDAIA